MREHRELFIGGRLVPAATDETLDVVSPATEETIGVVAAAGVGDVDRAVAAARRALDDGPWASATPAQRAAALVRLTDALRARADELAAVLTAEVGSPRSWSDPYQVGTALAAFDAFAALAGAYPWADERPAAHGSVLVRRLPVGVVGAVVPWNAPLFITALKLAPALVAGCTVVVKPAPAATLWSYLFADAVVEAGLPPGVVNIVPAAAAASEYLVGHPGIDKITFTGSTAVGRRIGEICGRDLRRCTLELGGKSAAILLDDLALTRRTVTTLTFGAMANSGQVCMAQTRILAPARATPRWSTCWPSGWRRCASATRPSRRPRSARSSRRRRGPGSRRTSPALGPTAPASPPAEVGRPDSIGGGSSSRRCWPGSATTPRSPGRRSSARWRW